MGIHRRVAGRGHQTMMLAQAVQTVLLFMLCISCGAVEGEIDPNYNRGGELGTKHEAVPNGTNTPSSRTGTSTENIGGTDITDRPPSLEEGEMDLGGQGVTSNEMDREPDSTDLGGLPGSIESPTMGGSPMPNMEPEAGGETVDNAMPEPGGDPAPDAMPVEEPVDDGPFADCTHIRVTSTGNLRLRPQPNTFEEWIALVPTGTQLEVLSVVDGEPILGVVHWFQVRFEGQLGYLSGRYAECMSIPRMAEGGVADDDAFFLPFGCGSRVRISQGNGGATSHRNRTQYAFDFAVGLNTPIRASRAGSVLLTQNSTGPNHRCYGGGGPDCGQSANYVVLVHSDGSRTSYVHLNRVDVAVGTQVRRGAQLGLSGSTGYSTGPHLHLERQEDCGATRYCQSIGLSFADVDGDGIPVNDEFVTSQNCP